jgi:PAS domain S-box-containing protein
MPSLKRLIRISFILLFGVVTFNLVGYFVIRNQSIENRLNEEGENLASSQQIYMQQIVGKIAALSIHHHFSQDQFANQLTYLREATASYRSGQEQLRGIITKTVKNVGTRKGTALRESDSSYQVIYSQAVALLENPQRNSNQWQDAGMLYAASGSYLPLMKELHDVFRADELRTEASIQLLNRVIIISLVACLLYLIVLVIAPIFRQNARNHQQLQQSLEDVRKTEALLQESERRYRYLFERNPMPMWIYDLKTLRFLEVNQMAIQHYGYSAEEFSAMTILDIRPEEDRKHVPDMTVDTDDAASRNIQGLWVHLTKNGHQIFVEIISHRIQYGDSQAMLILAKDVTRNIELQNELLEEKITHQREIARASVLVQEKERNEIGRELHDNVNQILTSVKLHLEFMGNIDSDREKHRLHSLNMVSTVIQEIRRLSRSLVPHTLNDVGLLPSVTDLVESLNSFGSVNFSFYSKDFEEDGIPAGLKLTVLRIIQEQTTNILKYARAQNAHIELVQHYGDLLLKIIDNGVGFDPQKNRKGIGLTNIMNRADIYHGRLKLQSSPGNGCELEVIFNLEKVLLLDSEPISGTPAQA